MASIKQTAAAIATILVREGVDYAQSKAVFKAARANALGCGRLAGASRRRRSADRRGRAAVS